MAILLLLFILSEALSLATLRQHLFTRHRITYYILLIFHFILSIWLWIIFVELWGYDSFFDNPVHVSLLMSLAGMICAVVLPRIILILLHFSGRLIRIRKGGYISWLTNLGFFLSTLFFILIAAGNLHGRFNFKDELVTIKIRDLDKDLDGLKIVQVSDMHLATFYRHPDKLASIMQRINSYNPDLILNTGDFVTFGWREFGRNDTILIRAKSRYGNYAVTGNHDAGTYNPEFTEADLTNNMLILNNKLKFSGYTALNDDNARLKIGNSILALVGVTTKGRFPKIIHGDIDKALSGVEGADLTILLSHDPNHWLEAIAGKREEVDLTLSGHTHGMQLGIINKKFKWSPASYFYPNWNGLYSHGNQQQYVNRGLGVLGVPFRIGMPPEITVITLKAE